MTSSIQSTKERYVCTYNCSLSLSLDNHPRDNVLWFATNSRVAGTTYY